MIRTLSHGVIAGSLAASALHAQSLQRRVLGDGPRDGIVDFSFASRDGVCGDGATWVRDGFGGNNQVFDGGNFRSGRRNRDWGDCIPGPVRVVLTLNDGQIVRIHSYVGPTAARGTEHRDLGRVSTADAAEFLTHIIQEGRGQPANDAILPLVLADSVEPWPALLGVARDEHVPRSVRATIGFWLARGATFALGIGTSDEDDEDDVRASAVFALSQQPRESAVPRLIDIVRASKRPAVRAQALFWLGQSGDPRALDLFEEILRRR